MKRIILATLIFLSGSSLMAQAKYEGTWSTLHLLSIADSSHILFPFYKAYHVETDTFVFNMPAKFENSITITTVEAVPWPPPSLQFQIEIPIDQLKKKSPQTRHSKAQIGKLLLIGTAIYAVWHLSTVKH